MNRIEKNLNLAFGLVALIFLVSGSVYLTRYQSMMSRDTYSEQEKVAKLTSTALTLYFDKLKFAIESAASSPAFYFKENADEDLIRFKNAEKNPFTPVFRDGNENWNYFKGLPLEYRGQLVASKRREVSRNILKNYEDIHYVFEMDINGDLIFLEPYHVQVGVTSFNYKFRDYLKSVKKTRRTSISEGYLSHDTNRTHIITVATPIFDRHGEVRKVFAASISAKTIYEKVLKNIAGQIDLKRKYQISLVDRHGHVVANSKNQKGYSPLPNQVNDFKDKGNLRKIGLFRKLVWSDDVFEKDNMWERKTKSWKLQNNLIMSDKYKNPHDTEMFGSLLPIKIYDENGYLWGLLIETPTSIYNWESNITIAGLAISLILVISLLFFVYRKTIREYRSIELDVRRAEHNLIQLGRKVKHDIQSPLTSLQYLLDSIKKKLSEEERVIGFHSLERITDITLTLSSEEETEQFEFQHNLRAEILFPLINRVVAEKRLEFKDRRGVTITLNNKLDYGVFVAIDRSKLLRTLSNLINNAIEAQKEGASLSVEVELSNSEESCCIKIVDDGVGIDDAELERIYEYGYSRNKKGQGIGLSQARDHVREAGGSIDLLSSTGIGTSVMIKIPRAVELDWFEKRLALDCQHLCIVDDDTTIYLLWQKRLKNSEISVSHFRTSSDFEFWVKSKDINEFYFLFDLELLGSNENGLDLIRKHKLSRRSTLVTSHYNIPKVQQDSLRGNVQIIPKDMVPDVPIRIKNKVRKNIVLIDDDELIHLMWSRWLDSENVSLSCFKTVDQFMQVEDQFGKETAIYVDSDLGGKVKGEVESRKIFEAGFSEIHLATGFDEKNIIVPSWIKSVRGKRVQPDLLEKSSPQLSSTQSH